MYAGYGRSEPCSGCDTPILPGQIEYEFEATDGTAVRFHLGCAGLWEAERRRRGWDRSDMEQAVEPRTELAHRPVECGVCRKLIAAETTHYHIGEARVHIECMTSFWSRLP
jgi:hypothetical protein